MLVESRSGKSGVAFDFLLDRPEGDFILVQGNGATVSPPAPVPERLKAPLEKPDLSLCDMVKKIQRAEARRASEVNRVRGAARAHNVHVNTTVKVVQQSYVNKYWQLDNKLRAADRRREELVAQIRAKAQEHSARVQYVNKTNDFKTKSLDVSINECLVRAAENRNKMLQQTRERIAIENSKKEYVRKAVAEEDSRTCMDTFWQLDKKLQEADRRRQQQLEEIREKASSPSERVTQIRKLHGKEVEQKAEKLAAQLNAAATRKENMVKTVKAKAHEEAQKVENVNLQRVLRTSNLDTETSLKLLKAEENRVKRLEEVRRNQKNHALKAERVRQAKRAINAQQ